MYHVTVKKNKEVIAESILDGLADAVSFGRDNSEKGNLITVWEAIQDASGDIVHTHKVLSMIMPEEYLKVIT